MVAEQRREERESHTRDRKPWRREREEKVIEKRRMMIYGGKTDSRLRQSTVGECLSEVRISDSAETLMKMDSKWGQQSAVRLLETTGTHY